MAMIKDNVARIKNDISLICQRLGRNPESVTLVGVTKFASLAGIEEALNCNISHIGENKVQEAKEKFVKLPAGTRVTRHMIGHLQTNKVKDALKIFDVIQSVDSLKLAQALEKEAGKLNHHIQIFVQVNISGEAQKHGVSESEALNLLREIGRFHHLKVTGLMGVAPLTQDENIIRPCFRKLKELFDEAQRTIAGGNIALNFLSMGMSNDYKVAIEEGSNMVRIGSAIFRKQNHE